MLRHFRWRHACVFISKCVAPIQAFIVQTDAPQWNGLLLSARNAALLARRPMRLQTKECPMITASPEPQTLLSELPCARMAELDSQAQVWHSFLPN